MNGFFSKLIASNSLLLMSTLFKWSKSSLVISVNVALLFVFKSITNVNKLLQFFLNQIKQTLLLIKLQSTEA